MGYDQILPVVNYVLDGEYIGRALAGCSATAEKSVYIMVMHRWLLDHPSRLRLITFQKTGCPSTRIQMQRLNNTLSWQCDRRFLSGLRKHHQDRCPFRMCVSGKRKASLSLEWCFGIRPRTECQTAALFLPESQTTVQPNPTGDWCPECPPLFHHHVRSAIWREIITSCPNLCR